MRSPGRIPNAARPSATFLTRSTKAAAEVLIHFPSDRWLRASVLPCRNADLRQRPGIDEASPAGKISFASLLAVAAEANGLALLRGLRVGLSYTYRGSNKRRHITPVAGAFKSAGPATGGTGSVACVLPRRRRVGGGGCAR